MRILLLTTIAPVGAPSGGVLVTSALSRRLAAYGEVERWAAWTYETEPTEPREWRGTLPITLSGLRRHGVLRALSRRLPLTISRFFREGLARELAALGAFDLFFADHLGVWQYDRVISAKRRVMFTHNVESEIYERAESLEGSALKRPVWRYEARAMRRYEAAVLRQPDAVVCLGSRDQALMAERYGVRAEAFYPPVEGATPVRAKRAAGAVVGSVGSMTWQPNRWGMDWFVEEVWPLVRRRLPEVRLRLAGRGSQRLPYAGAPGIECLGQISDLEDFYESLDAVVAPVRGGAGIKVKVMDAAARGLPLVTTAGGVEGLGPEVPPGVAVADDPGVFADLVVRSLASRPPLPLAESVEWYGRLVASGDSAVARAVLGSAGGRGVPPKG